jgi:hypothetical protein
MATDAPRAAASKKTSVPEIPRSTTPAAAPSGALSVSYAAWYWPDYCSIRIDQAGAGFPFSK